MHKTQLRVKYDVEILSDPIFNSADTYNYFKSIWNKSLLNLQEQVYIIYLNGSNQVTCWNCLNTGTCSETLFDVKLAMSCGISCMANKLIVAHNHPSGILKPSGADLMITQRLKDACCLMDMILMDHLIINTKGYISLADYGYIAN